MATSSALLLCLVAAVAVVATSQPLKNPPDFTINNPGAKTTVKIGCLLPFSGDYAVKGIAAHNGIKLALADFAAQNKGYNFVLTCLDSQCSAEYAKTAAATMKTRGVAGVIGEICSSASLAAKEVLAPILLVSPTSTSSKLTIAGDNFFRVGIFSAVKVMPACMLLLFALLWSLLCPSCDPELDPAAAAAAAADINHDADHCATQLPASLCCMQIISADKFQAVVLANLIKGSGAAAPVGIVADTGAYGTSLADSFTASYKKIGGTVPTRVTITPTNAAAAAQELAKAGIKKVLIATNNDTW
jgi:ABC-type branched-subunit amino acid transport system substrate-binding protein